MLRLTTISGYIILLLMAVSCHHRITCPAYQSQFILDDNQFKQRFSLFKADSTPKEKIGHVKKNKYGIVVEKSYRKKFSEMQNVPMETIYPEEPDSLMIAWVVPDSIAADSPGPGPVYYSPYLTLFNNDQALYDALYGHLLQPPVSPKQELREDLQVESSTQEEPEVTEDKKKGFWLFGKKKRKNQKEDETTDESKEEEEE